MLLGLRVPFQQRTFYFVGIFWLLALTVGVYRYFGPRSKLLEPVVSYELFNNLEVDVKTKRIFTVCNPTQEIVTGDEGIPNNKQWSLKGLLVLIRHGDRGPLQHIKNISNINCGTPDNDLITSYKSYLHNLTSAGRVSWIGPGSFHGFPLLPSHEKQCQLGQLTMQGVNQLLHLGHVLKQTYKNIWPRLLNLTQYEISVYSTRYRRTFQSALAFLYGLISPETLTRIAILESQSMYFCFKDCGCQVTEKYLKLVQKDISNRLKSHPAISGLAESTGKMIFSSLATNKRHDEDPHAIKDALLTYVCHGSKLPCVSARNCIKRQNIVGIFAYTDWVSHQKWKNFNWRRLCLLRSYGLIRHIVSQMLAMVHILYYIQVMIIHLSTSQPLSVFKMTHYF
ncbi:2-phosphoxylose phosphatase 1 isoform X2 [Onthophagus taurus]|uniref:2-phosphoxylose phosphatase 1 isoform X2 n=1 Tax=Onthophagus taurus TaxID=166361 RepID=UPI0039BDB274